MSKQSRLLVSKNEMDKFNKKVDLDNTQYDDTPEEISIFQIFWLFILTKKKNLNSFIKKNRILSWMLVISGTTLIFGYFSLYFLRYIAFDL